MATNQQTVEHNNNFVGAGAAFNLMFCCSATDADDKVVEIRLVVVGSGGVHVFAIRYLQPAASKFQRSRRMIDAREFSCRRRVAEGDATAFLLIDEADSGGGGCLTGSMRRFRRRAARGERLRSVISGRAD